MLFRIAVAVSGLGVVGLGCGSDDASNADEAGDESSTGVDPSCVAPTGCGGVSLPDAVVLTGWFTQTNQTRIYASFPGTACGNMQAAGCDDCGSYRSISLELPPMVFAGDTFEADDPDITATCAQRQVSCTDGGGADEAAEERLGSVEIVQVSETCISGRLVGMSDCEDTAFIAAVCAP